MSRHRGLTAASPAQAPLGPGLALLRDCVRGVPRGALEDRLTELREGRRSVFAAADRHGLVPLVYQQVRQAHLEASLPPADWARLAEARELALSRQALLVAAGTEMIGSLAAAGVGWALPLKGLALAARLWPECLPRTMDDVDLLVPREQLPDAEAVVQALGFARPSAPQPSSAHHHAPLRRRGVTQVELHWSLWTPSALPIPHPSPKGVADRSTLVLAAGGEIAVPNAEDLFILSAGALARESFDVLFRAWADLHWLLTDPRLGLRHDALRALAGELELTQFTDLMVRLVGWLLGDVGSDLAEPASPVRQAEARLRPIVIRRLHEGTHRADRHAFLLQGARRGVRLPVGAAMRGAGLLRATRYAAGLVLSRRQRRELREEIVIRRSLASLRG